MFCAPLKWCAHARSHFSRALKVQSLFRSFAAVERVRFCGHTNCVTVAFRLPKTQKLKNIVLCCAADCRPEQCTRCKRALTRVICAHNARGSQVIYPLAREAHHREKDPSSAWWTPMCTTHQIDPFHHHPWRADERTQRM